MSGCTRTRRSVTAAFISQRPAPMMVVVGVDLRMRIHALTLALYFIVVRVCVCVCVCMCVCVGQQKMDISPQAFRHRRRFLLFGRNRLIGASSRSAHA